MIRIEEWKMQGFHCKVIKFEFDSPKVMILFLYDLCFVTDNKGI
jgi:hypothetical protein